MSTGQQAKRRSRGRRRRPGSYRPDRDDDVAEPAYVPEAVLVTHLLTAPGLGFVDAFRICTMSRASLDASKIPSKAALLERALRVDLPDVCAALDRAEPGKVLALVSGQADVDLVRLIELLRQLEALHMRPPRSKVDLCRRIDRLLESHRIAPSAARARASPEAQSITLRLLFAVHEHVLARMASCPEGKKPAVLVGMPGQQLNVFACASAVLAFEYILACRVQPRGGHVCVSNEPRMRATLLAKARSIACSLDSIHGLESLAHCLRLRTLCGAVVHSVLYGPRG